MRWHHRPMREVSVAALGRPTEGKTLAACLATILEVDLTDVPEPPPGQELPAGGSPGGWAASASDSFRSETPRTSPRPGPWIGIVRPAADEERLAVVMYGVPSGVAWDPWGAAEAKDWRWRAGSSWPHSTLRSLGQAFRSRRRRSGRWREASQRAAPASRHSRETDSSDFLVGSVRCRGMRLCEPCRVVDRYASRPVLRALVHRGGLRADILEDGVMHVGDEVRPSVA
jgi:hypothetical protein